MALRNSWAAGAACWMGSACGALSVPQGERDSAADAALFSPGAAGAVENVVSQQTGLRFTGALSGTDCSAVASEGTQRIALASARQGTRSSRVAVFGDTALVGLPAAENGGAAVFFRHRGEQWCRELTVEDGGLGSKSEFGHAVALDKDLAAIGAPGKLVGSVLVLRRGEAGWKEEAQLVAPEEGARAFGAALAVFGERLLIGAPGYQQAPGAAYLFESADGAWDAGRLLAGPLEAGDRFGQAVALDGNTAVVGAPGTSSGQGSAYVFEGSNGWRAPRRLAVEGGGEQFGSSAAIEGDDLVIGAPAHGLPNGSALAAPIPIGRAYTFRHSWNGWSTASRLNDAVDSIQDHLGAVGASVALSAGTVLVGAGGAENGRGVVGVSRTTSYGLWCPILRLQASERVIYSNFGSSVALSGSTAWVGAQEPSSAAYALDLTRVTTTIYACAPPPPPLGAPPAAEADGAQPCDELRDHILSRFQSEVAGGVLVSNAVPCGPDGVASHPEAFASNTAQAEVDRVSSEFQALCAEFQEKC